MPVYIPKLKHGVLTGRLINLLAHVKSKCDYFCESSHHVGFKSSLAHSLYMSELLI